MKLTMVVVLVLLVAALSAHASGGSEQAPAAAAGSLKGRLSLWTAWRADQGVGDWVTAFNKIYPDIEIEIIQCPNSGEGNIKINTALMAGDQIDVVVSYGLTNFVRRAETSLLYDITDLVARDKVDITGEWGLEVPINNRTYAIPFGGNNDHVAINADMYRNAGIPVPTRWTLDEYIQIARKLTKGEAEKKVYGSSNFHTNYYAALLARGIIGNDWFYNREGLSNFDSPYFKRALDFSHRLEVIEKIQFPLSEYRASGLQAADAFVSGRVASSQMTAYLARYIKDKDKFPRDFKVSYANIPSLEEGKTNYNDGIYYFSYLGIAAKTKALEPAWAFVKWLATDGSLGLAPVGHLPLWKKTNKDALVQATFGASVGEVDAEAYKRVVLGYGSPSYIDTELTAIAEVTSVFQQEILKCLSGQITVDEALASSKSRADDAIKKARIEASIKK